MPNNWRARCMRQDLIDSVLFRKPFGCVKAYFSNLEVKRDVILIRYMKFVLSGSLSWINELGSQRFLEGHEWIGQPFITKTVTKIHSFWKQNGISFFLFSIVHPIYIYEVKRLFSYLLFYLFFVNCFLPNIL